MCIRDRAYTVGMFVAKAYTIDMFVAKAYTPGMFVDKAYTASMFVDQTSTLCFSKTSKGTYQGFFQLGNFKKINIFF